MFYYYYLLIFKVKNPGIPAPNKVLVPVGDPLTVMAVVNERSSQQLRD